MPEKRVKNEQWYVKDLKSKIDNGEIKKPKFQRKKKWDIKHNPKKNSFPSEEKYIEFLYKTRNSVHPITFGQETKEGKIIFVNIDGNNRINAIFHFLTKPFEIFTNYLNEIFNFIDDFDEELLNEVEKALHSSSSM